MSDGQLDLFNVGDASTTKVDPELAALAQRLPPTVRFGTSSWTFPGWKGLVYHRPYRSQKQFVRESLQEYARYPLFRTVGVDRSYYAPVPQEEFERYRQQLPEGFECVGKVWSELTTRRFANHSRFGARAGTDNSEFLNPKIFDKEVKQPWLRGLEGKAGPLVLEIPPSPGPSNPEHFVDRLDAFLGQVKEHTKICVELRDRGLLTEDYFAVLRDHGASHVFNFWERMPTVRSQLELPGSLTGPFVVARLLLPPGRRYEDQKKAFDPFDRIVGPQPKMRADVVTLIDAAIPSAYPVYIIVNNKAEGCSPLTVQALVEALAKRQEP